MKLQEHVLKSASGEYARKVWLLPPPHGVPEKIGIFLDGEYYLKPMGAPAILTRLQKGGKIPRLLGVFVSHFDNEARHRDLICNPRYADFITVDLVRWLREKIPSLPAAGHLMAGPSLGGLTAVWLALAHPKLFSYCLCHSGSFWWQDEWLVRHLGQMPAAKGKFWLSVGGQETETGISHAPSGLRQEVAQLSASRHLATELTGRGDSVHLHVYKGGHEIKPWKKELPGALEWLFRNPS